MEWFDAENINKLESWEVHIILYNSSADKYCVHINKLINEHVDACKSFPRLDKMGVYQGFVCHSGL